MTITDTAPTAVHVAADEPRLPVQQVVGPRVLMIDPAVPRREVLQQLDSGALRRAQGGCVHAAGFEFPSRLHEGRGSNQTADVLGAIRGFHAGSGSHAIHPPVR